MTDAEYQAMSDLLHLLREEDCAWCRDAPWYGPLKQLANVGRDWDPATGHEDDHTGFWSDDIMQDREEHNLLVQRHKSLQDLYKTRLEVCQAEMNRLRSEHKEALQKAFHYGAFMRAQGCYSTQDVYVSEPVPVLGLID